MSVRDAPGVAGGETPPETLVPGQGRLYVPRARGQPEIEELLRLLARALAGSGCPVVVIGEPGSGKTWLADQVCNWARDHGVLILWATCEVRRDAPPLWPWVQLLREYLRSHTSSEFPAELKERMAEVIEMLPGIDRILRGNSVPEMPEADTVRFSLFDAISQVLRRASQDRPLLIVFDGIHRADDASLGLLEHVAGDLSGARAMVVALSRPLSSRSSVTLRGAIAAVSGARGGHVLRLGMDHAPTLSRGSSLLSARELEVAELVADGLTNRGIADHLYISERTAENHVQHILNKLGSSSRSQVAAWAERNRK